MTTNDPTTEILSGGVNSVVRRGATVERPMGLHSPAVHLVLAHLEQVGFVGAPRLLSTNDALQTETLTYLEGTVADYPLPLTFTSDKAMRSAAQLLRRLHDAHDALYLRDVEYLEANRAVLIGEASPPTFTAAR